MEQERIKHMNDLYHLSKERELTPQEAQELNALRQEYVASFRASLVGQLENTYIIDEHGNKRRLGRKAEK